MLREGPDSLAEALMLARRGWPVFPCRPGSKEPATKHGFQDATTDERTIRWWWRRTPNANIAIATGCPGPDVLDVDVKAGENGYRALLRLARAGMLSGAVAVARTPSGGCHVYYPGTSQGCSSLRRHGLDFKATGGYVLAAPSVIDAGAYEWCERRDEGTSLDWAEVRRFLDPPVPRKRPAGQASGSITGLVRTVAGATDGNRNNALYWAAKHAVLDGHTSADDGRALVDAAVSTGLAELEARRTIASAYKRFGGSDRG